MTIDTNTNKEENKNNNDIISYLKCAVIAFDIDEKIINVPVYNKNRYD